MFTNPLCSQIIFVKPNGNGNGSSWAQAKGDLVQALNVAPKGATLWVATGTYTPTLCTNCRKQDRQISFVIPDSVAVYGGFAGTETSLSQRNWRATPSVLSGDIDRDGTLAQNSFNIIYLQNVSSATLIDGFTIQGGNANDTSFAIGERTTSGGAIFNDGRVSLQSDPSVKNCIFKENYAIGYGGAVCNSGGFNGKSAMSFRNCQFINNRSHNEGGAVANFGHFNGRCTAVFEFCQFTNNHSDAAGGAVFNNGINGLSNPQFINCRFVRNSTNTYGGGIYNLGKNGDCSPTIAGCLFWANQAFSAGGVYCLGSERGNSSPLITNSIFYKNEANTCGSVYANAADSTGKAAPQILNSIIWGNIATTAPYIRSVFSKPFLNYAIIDAPNSTAVFRDGVSAAGTCGAQVVYNQSPLFINADAGDFRLLPQSPAVNMGLDSVVQALGLMLDLDSLPRTTEGRVDIGCIESNPALYFPPRLEESPANRTVCEREIVVLKAKFSGTPPLFFQWYKNDIAIPNETHDSLKFSSGINLADSGVYRCVVRNAVNSTVTSANASLKTKPILPLSISIAADRIPQCEGDSVTFTATWTNGGVLPGFDWRLNDSPLGLAYNTTQIRVAYNSIFFRFKCLIHSSEQCAMPNPAVSNELRYVNILPKDTANLSLARTPTGEVCAGDTISFSTTAQHAGDTPQYQWYRNNTLITNSLNTYRIANLNNGDIIKAVMTSSKKCLIKNPVESNPVAVAIRTRTPVSVRAVASKTDICAGDTVTITATPTGGGTTPQYQWVLNDVPINGANAFFHRASTFRDNDRIWVQLFSSEKCPSVNPALSDPIRIRLACTPVEEAIAQSILLAPNPASSAQFSIVGLAQWRGEKTINLYDARGQILLSQKLPDTQEALSFNPDLPNGIYWVRITVGSVSLYKKWVLAR
jgi:hypothetical protein